MAPALPVPFVRLDQASWQPDAIPVWDGTPFNVAYAIDVLYAPPVAKAAMTRPT